MIIHLHKNKFNIKGIILVMLVMLLQVGEVMGETFYWRGGQNGSGQDAQLSWFNEKNWEVNGVMSSRVPSTTDDVIIGDDGFDGNNQPSIFGKGFYAYCRNLEIREGKTSIKGTSKSPSLTLAIGNGQGNGLAVSVSGDIVIKAGGKMINYATTLDVDGNWVNDGIYIEYIVGSGNTALLPSVRLNGINKTLGGLVSTKFSLLRIFGSITLKQNIVIKPFYPGSIDRPWGLVVWGTLDPQLNKVSWERVSTSSYDFTVRNGGVIYVRTTNFQDNYEVTKLVPDVMFPTLLEASSTINYGGVINQNILSSKEYTILRVSGSGIKTLLDPLVLLGTPTTITSDLYVDAATLDIAANSLNRTTTGGTMKVSNGATLRLSGLSNFPANFSTVTLESSASSSLASSTVEYYKVGAQNVVNHTYGNLFITREGEKTILGSNIRLQVEELLKLENAGGTQNDVILQTGTTNTIVLGTNKGSISELEKAYVTGTVETTKTLGVVAPQANGFINSFGNIGITVNSPADMGSVKIIRKTGPLGRVGNGNNVHRVFEVIPPTGYNTANKAVITLSYFDHENASPEDKLLAYWSDTNPTTSWWRTINPSGANQVLNTVTINNVTPHRFFTLGRGATPFPVEMISFTAAKKGADAVLNWAVAQEKDNNGFEVQASTDGKDYQKIGFVASKVGTSSIKQEYSFTDSRSNKYGTVYYRLKQLDLDGKATLFGPREVNFGKVTVATVTAHPNPIKENLSVVVTTPDAGNADVTIHDMMGKIWLTEDQQVNAGRTVLDLNLQNGMPAGIYILTLKLNEGIQTFKLVKE